jgi:hypothetical protein
LVTQSTSSFSAPRDRQGVGRHALVGRAAADQLVVGPVRALRAEGDFGGVVDEVAEVCRAYGARVVTDEFSSAAVVERLRQRHRLAVAVRPMSAASKTAMRARLYDGSLRLPDHLPLTAELRRLRTPYTAGSAPVVNSGWAAPTAIWRRPLRSRCSSYASAAAAPGSRSSHPTSARSSAANG